MIRQVHHDFIDVQTFTDDNWAWADRTAICTLFWNQFTIFVYHRHHNPLLIAGFDGLVWLDRCHIVIRLDNQVYFRRDTLTDTFYLTTISLT